MQLIVNVFGGERTESGTNTTGTGRNKQREKEELGASWEFSQQELQAESKLKV